MPIQSINIGASPNDGLGDVLRTAFDKVNQNFTDLESRKQAALASGENIKQINGESILGSGSITLATWEQFVALAAEVAALRVLVEEGGSVTPAPPTAFASGNWTAAAGVEQIVLDITALPATGGSPLTELQYRVGTGQPVTLAGTGTGQRAISGLTAGTDYSLQIRAVNAVGAGAWSDTKSATPTAAAAAPSAFVAGDWTLAAGDGQAALTITTLPNNGGSAITALQYRLNAGSAVALSGTGAGSRTISSLTNGTAYSVQVRAVNAVGPGTWSDTKSVTPAAQPGGTPATALLFDAAPILFDSTPLVF